MERCRTRLNTSQILSMLLLGALSGSSGGRDTSSGQSHGTNVMPTILSHTAVPLALGVGLGARVISTRVLLVGIAASVLPGLDVIGFRFHVDYADVLGHRGLSHSLVFAGFVGILAACFF